MTDTAHRSQQVAEFVNATQVRYFHNLNIFTLGQLSDWMVANTPEDMLKIKGIASKAVALCIMMMDDYKLDYSPEFRNWNTNEFMVTEEAKEWYNKQIERKEVFINAGVPFNYGRGGSAVGKGGKPTTYNTSAQKIARAKEIVQYYYAHDYDATATCKEFLIYEDDHSALSRIAEEIALLKRENAFDSVMTMIGIESDDMEVACKNTIREGFSATTTEIQIVEINRNQGKELRVIAPDLTDEQIAEIIKGKLIIGTLKVSVKIPDYRVRIQAAQAWIKSNMAVAKVSSKPAKDVPDESFEDGSGSIEEGIIEFFQRAEDSGTVNIKKLAKKHFGLKSA